MLMMIWVKAHATDSDVKVSGATKKIQLVSYPDAAVSIASSGFSTNVSSVEDVIAVQGKPKRVVARIGVPASGIMQKQRASKSIGLFLGSGPEGGDVL